MTTTPDTLTGYAIAQVGGPHGITVQGGIIHLTGETVTMIVSRAWGTASRTDRTAHVAGQVHTVSRDPQVTDLYWRKGVSLAKTGDQG